MIVQSEMDKAIEESYDLMAMLQISTAALEALEGNLTPSYNRAVGDVRRVLTAAYKKAVITLDTLEGVERRGFNFEGVAGHG